MTWAEVGQTVVAGLAGMLGVYGSQEVLEVLRRRGWCPARWEGER